MAKARNRKRAEMDIAGYDGAVTTEMDVRISHARKGARTIRARPGTFEWKYGRKSDMGALYHAGVHFADLWERAGTAAASSPDMEAINGGQWKGIQDSRVVAMEKIKQVRLEIGKWSTARLVDYCVLGTTSTDMAAKYDTDERGMAHVLHMDLRACATALHYL